MYIPLVGPVALTTNFEKSHIAVMALEVTASLLIGVFGACIQKRKKEVICELYVASAFVYTSVSGQKLSFAKWPAPPFTNVSLHHPSDYIELRCLTTSFH